MISRLTSWASIALLLGPIAFGPWVFGIGPTDDLLNAQAAGTPLVSEWTEHSRVSDLGGGKKQIEASGGPINFQAPWKAVTDWTELAPEWMTAAAPWDYQSLPGGSEYDIRLDSTLTSGQIIEWEIDGSTVTFQPHDLLWSNSLDQLSLISTPQSSAVFFTQFQNNRVGWGGAYGLNTSLWFTLTNGGLAKELQFTDSAALPAPPQFIIDGGDPVVRWQFIFAYSNDLDIFVDGVEWDTGGGGGAPTTTTTAPIEFRRGGETLFGFKAPRAWDSSPDERMVTLVTELKKQGNSLFISTLTPKSWLDSATYPVYIDPTVDVSVSADADDGQHRENHDFVDPNDVRIGDNPPQGGQETFQRFLGVTIPDGATILGTPASTFLEFFPAATDSSANVNVTIQAEDVADATAPTDDTEWHALSLTAASVDWTGIGAWVNNTAIGTDDDSLDVSSIFQELVDDNGGLSNYLKMARRHCRRNHRSAHASCNTPR